MAEPIVVETPVLELDMDDMDYCSPEELQYACASAVHRLWPNTKHAKRISIRFATEPHEGSIPIKFAWMEHLCRIGWGVRDSTLWCRRDLFPPLKDFLLAADLVPRDGVYRALHVSVVIHEEASKCSDA